MIWCMYFFMLIKESSGLCPGCLFQPGIMAREYVDGKRRIFNPFQYFIFSVGFLFFLMTQSHFYESVEAYNTERAARLPGYFQKAMADFSRMLKNYANAITFLLLPVYAFFAWRFFKKKGHNYAEHFTILVFAMSFDLYIKCIDANFPNCYLM
jgi:hypothetical protein